MIPINKNPSRQELRQFGGIWMVFFSGVAAVVWYRTGDLNLAIWVWVSAIGVGAAGFAYLPLMRMIYLGMSYLAFPIGWTVSHLLLASIYYLILSPIALVLRITGRDSLERRLDRSATSYWTPHPESEEQSRYFRQF